MQGKQSVAYDLSIYEPKPAAVRPKLEVVEKQSPKKKVSFFERLQILCVAAVLVASLSLIIYNNVILTELSDEINTVNKQYQAYQSEYKRLASELEGKMSLRNVEEIATSQLGLSKMESYQVMYVDRCEGDKIILTADSPTEAGGLTERFDAVMEYLRITFNKN